MSFAHLHVHTEYSLLDGAARIKNLVQAVKEAGMDAVAITDHGAMYGVIEFYKAAKNEGVKPIIGCEVYLAPGDRRIKAEVEGVRYYHLILLAENNEGYRNLSQLVSLANIEGMYYKPRVDKEILRKYSKGLICLSACVAGEIPQAIINDDFSKAEKLTEEYIDIFGKENFFLEMQNHGLKEELKTNPRLVELADKYGLGLVVTNDVHYTRREDSEFHEILLCIQTNKTVNDNDRMRFSSDDYYLKTPDEMAELFPGMEEALENSAKIAQRCNVDFEFGKLQLPYYPIPQGFADDREYLVHLCKDKIKERYAPLTREVQERLDYELDIIHRMGYDSYFLIVWDFINYARGNGIAVGPGRGSAAGSIVAYALGITNIDPLKYALLFERFLNPERVSMPDIDIDFCYIRRPEVIEYVKRRYGEDHVAQIVTFGTMAAKGAIRDVGRVLGMSYGEVDRIAKKIPFDPKITISRALEESRDFAAIYEESEANAKLIDMARRIEGLPRHSSTHAAGIVIAKKPLTDYLPVQMVDGTLVTEYDKDYVEELGLLKMDFLGLRTLTVISDTLEAIEKDHGIRVDIDKIPLVDEKTAAILKEGKTGGVFQMESAGMTNLVRDIAPDGFVDLIPTVALYRPGPLGSGMVEDFVNGRRGKKQVTYMHPLLEPILKETFGVVLYQEQVMQIVQVLAGFTLGEADLLRRAMGKKKAEILFAQKEKFLTGCGKKNIDPALAQKIFDLLTHFADYGFNKSHSAAYALVAWQTAYLKAHYPLEFMAATLSSIMDTQRAPTYLELCRRMGIKILPPDINRSNAGFSVDSGAIRFGLAGVRNVGEAAVLQVEKSRKEKGPFTSLLDFCTRIGGQAVNKRALESLIKCGAFDSFGHKRMEMLIVLDGIISMAEKKQEDERSGQMGLFGAIDDAPQFVIPKMNEASYKELLAWEKEVTGFFITGHPLDQYRDKIRRLTTIGSIKEKGVKNGQKMRLAGIVQTARRHTTKKGDLMCFVTLEDFTDAIDVTIFPDTYYANMDLVVPDAPLVIQGRIDADGNEIKLLAGEVWPLDKYLPEYYLTIGRETDTAATYEELRKIFAEHHGDHVLYIQAKGRWQKAEANYWLDGSAEVLERLQNLLGKNMVRMM